MSLRAALPRSSLLVETGRLLTCLPLRFGDYPGTARQGKCSGGRCQGREEPPRNDMLGITVNKQTCRLLFYLFTYFGNVTLTHFGVQKFYFWSTAGIRK